MVLTLFFFEALGIAQLYNQHVLDIIVPEID